MEEIPSRGVFLLKAIESRKKMNMKTLSLNGIGRVVIMLVLALIMTRCEKAVYSGPAEEVTERGGLFNKRGQCACITDSFPIEELSNREIEALVYMREEEKLARDLYLHFAATWSNQAFSNIAKAEQRHMNAVLCLIEKYGLTDPIGSNGRGVFTNNTLQEFYNTFLAQGNEGLAQALFVGAAIEDLDIYDLRNINADPQVDNADLKLVFGNLMRGSRNHLRAFESNLEAIDLYYTAQYITQEEYEAILNSDWETGMGTCGLCPGQNTGNQNGPQGGMGNGPGNGTGICPAGNNGNGPNGMPPGNGKRKRG